MPLLLVALVACGGGQTAERGDRSAKAADARRARQVRAADPGCRFLIASTFRHRTTAPPVEDLLLLNDAFAQADACYDRVTFVFSPTGENQPPGYVAEYVESPVSELGDDGRQHTIESIDRDNPVLLITFTPTRSRDPTKPGEPQTYLGNLRLRLEGMESVVLVRKFINDDASPERPQVRWLVELDTRRPFLVDSFVGVEDGAPRAYVNLLVMH